MRELPEYVDGFPNLSGNEHQIDAAVREGKRHRVFVPQETVGFGEMESAFAIALHMHQPLIPADGSDLRTAGLIGHLQWMMANQGLGDNHNAPVFLWCYKRMAEFLPQLLHEGRQPRVMLEYSGTLLHGLRRMGAGDVLEGLARITCDPYYRQAIEWLGCPWGHAVAPSTPIQDYRLHVRAWQHHFAAIFGLEALGRIRGFSPSEMALPNHPDVAYEFVKTLLDCGYEWVLVQVHTVEASDGRGLTQPHLPHRLVCTNSRGETASITAIVKTQGSDTKLVGQMQPYYEAKGLSRVELAGRRVPPLVTQIADGENGGVMMNEFPPKYFDVMRECSGSRTPIVNGTEYLERLYSLGIQPSNLPVIQPLFQVRIWERMSPGDGPERLAQVIEELSREDGRFHMEGGSWTNDVSWVRGYENVLAPMERASSLFHERALAPNIPTSDPRYRNALFHLLASETSCYRYWGHSIWSDYGVELSRRTSDILTHDLPPPPEEKAAAAHSAVPNPAVSPNGSKGPKKLASIVVPVVTMTSARPAPSSASARNSAWSTAAGFLYRLFPHGDRRALRDPREAVLAAAPISRTRWHLSAFQEARSGLLRILEAYDDSLNAVTLTAAESRRAFSGTIARFVTSSNETTEEFRSKLVGFAGFGTSLTKRSGRLASRLVGRLQPRVHTPAVHEPTPMFATTTRRFRLRQSFPALQEAGGPLRVLKGHDGSVNAVAVTTDGRRAVSGSADRTLKVWDLESGHAINTLSGHADAVTAVAVTPDRRRAVSGSADNTLKVWDLETGRLLQTLEGHGDWITAVALTPDGRRALSASADMTLKLWDLESGRVLHTLAGHADWVTAVAVTPDGQRAISGSEDKTLEVWDLESGRGLKPLEGHTDLVLTVAVTPDGRRAVSGSHDKTLKVWDLETGRCVHTLEGHAELVLTVAVAPDGRCAVSGSGDSTLKIWDLEDGRALDTIEGHAGCVYAVAVTPDGRRVVCGSWDSTLKVWDLESGGTPRRPAKSQRPSPVQRRRPARTASRAA